MDEHTHGTLRFWREACFLPLHWSDWFLQFRLKAYGRFMPPYAGRRLPGNQISGRLFPTVSSAAGFDDILDYRRIIGWFAFAHLSATYQRRCFLCLVPNAHDHNA